jgi:hypothetical protein
MVSNPESVPLEPYITPEKLRVDQPSFTDRISDTVDGRDCIRIDRYGRNALGEVALVDRTWVDSRSRRFVRRQSSLRLEDRQRLGREFRTEQYTYTDTGPTGLSEIGLPPALPVVDERQRAETSDRGMLPAVERALLGASQAIARFPRDCRVVWSDGHSLEVQYWSCSESFREAWARGVASGDYGRVYTADPPRSFFADHQNFSDLLDDLRRPLETNAAGPLPADVLVRWLPRDQAVNLALADGSREFRLTRFVAGAGEDRKTRLHVRRQQVTSFPKSLESLWPHAWTSRVKLSLGESDPSARGTLLSLRVEYDQLAFDWDIDPGHSYIATRQVTYRKVGNDWEFSEEAKATRFEQLANGPSYVSNWEVRTAPIVDDAGDRGPGREEERRSIRRLSITPLGPDEFPEGIFDGEKLMDDARKEGAEIVVD